MSCRWPKSSSICAGATLELQSATRPCRTSAQSRGSRFPLGWEPQVFDNAAQQTIVVVDRLQGAAYFFVEQAPAGPAQAILRTPRKEIQVFAGEIRELPTNG